MPYTSWCTCTPPSFMFRNGPRPSRIARVTARVTRKVTRNAATIQPIRARRPVNSTTRPQSPGPTALLHQAPAHALGDRRGAVRDPELLVQPLGVGLDRADAEEQL